MGLFDFLKPKPSPALMPAATLEALLAQAAQDPVYQPEFYRRLLVEPLVIITAGDPAMAEEKSYVSDGSPLQVVCWENGHIPVFTTPARIFDAGVVQHQVVYSQLKGRALLEMLRDKTLFINPYSDFTKELLPAEIGRILDGTVLQTGTRITVEKKTQVRIGQPAVYPTEMVQALVRLLGQEPRVRTGYLAWIHDPAAPEPPHYILCLDVEGEMRTISQKTGFVAQQFLAKGELIDIVQAGQSSLTDYFRQTKPFYEG